MQLQFIFKGSLGKNSNKSRGKNCEGKLLTSLFLGSCLAYSLCSTQVCLPRAGQWAGPSNIINRKNAHRFTSRLDCWRHFQNWGTSAQMTLVCVVGNTHTPNKHKDPVSKQMQNNNKTSKTPIRCPTTICNSSFRRDLTLLASSGTGTYVYMPYMYFKKKLRFLTTCGCPLAIICTYPQVYQKIFFKTSDNSLYLLWLTWGHFCLPYIPFTG